jgi:hypothetical protein
LEDKTRGTATYNSPSSMDTAFYIDFERTGGFTSIPVRVILSDKVLNAEELAEILSMIESVDFRSLKSGGRSGKSLPDQFLYRILVETPEYRHSITLYEQEVTPGLRPLILFLSGKARVKK